jgi:hypothetical protein
MIVVAGIATTTAWAASPPYSGQVFFAGGSIEPAINDANGATVYLLTPKNAPTNANPAAVAPLYLPVYPLASTIDPATLNCQPTNCDHVNVLPFSNPLYPLGTVTVPAFGTFPGGTFTGGTYLGHNHLVGVPPTGDFNVAWHVYLLAFTPKAAIDGAINTRLTTLDQIAGAVLAGDLINTMPPQGPANPTGAVGIDTGIVFNCAIVSSKVYTQNLG